MNFILTHLGPDIPAYLKTCIEQFRVFNPGAPLYFIGQKKHLKNWQNFFSAQRVTAVFAEDLESDKRIKRFQKKHWFKKWGRPQTIYPSPRNFWQYTIERIFFIECFMRQKGLRDVFHFENDVLIYRDLTDIHQTARRIDAQMIVTPVGTQWDSFAFAFIRQPEILEEFCDFILRHTSMTEVQIHKKYGIDRVTDMTLLKIFAEKNPKTAYFPILPQGEHAAHFEAFQSVFDGLTWGQFIAGSNEGHPPGWTLEKYYVGAELIAEKYDVIWEVIDGLRLPFIRDVNGKKIRLNNLHIHNKRLETYVSKNWKPAENEKLLHEIFDSFQVEWRDTHSRGNTLTPEEQLQRNPPRPFLLKALEAFKARGGKRIVEIGTAGSPFTHGIEENAAKWGEHCCNSGHSTSFFALSEAEEVWSVDINPEAARNARKNLAESEHTKHCRNVRLVTQDALKFLKDFDKPIDLLYLDGWDLAPNRYGEEHLAAYLLAKKNLHEKSLILIDDTDLDRGGKGKRVVPQAIRDGYRVVFKGRQTLLTRASVPLDYDPTRVPDFKFTYDTNDFATHQPVLYHMIKMTTGPILELGCGNGSTPLIHQFAPGRKIITVDSNLEYLNPQKERYEGKDHQFIHMPDWKELLRDPRFDQRWSIVFIDHSPWEARHEALLKFRDQADYIVMHDSDYFAREGLFGKQIRPILYFLDEGIRNYDDVLLYWKEFFPKKPWLVGTGPPTLVGSNFNSCDFNVSFDI